MNASTKLKAAPSGAAGLTRLRESSQSAEIADDQHTWPQESAAEPEIRPQGFRIDFAAHVGSRVGPAAGAAAITAAVSLQTGLEAPAWALWTLTAHLAACAAVGTAAALARGPRGWQSVGVTLLLAATSLVSVVLADAGGGTLSAVWLLGPATAVLCAGWALLRVPELATVLVAALASVWCFGAGPEDPRSAAVGAALLIAGLLLWRRRKAAEQDGRREGADARRNAQLCRAVEEARHAAVRYRRLAAGASEAVAVCEKRRIVDVNERLLSLFGYSREELQGRPLADLMAPWQTNELPDVWTAAREKALEITAVRSDGAPTPAEVQVRSAPGEDLHVAVVSFRDRTEGRLTEERRNSDEERAKRRLDEVEHLYRTAPVGLALIDESMRIVRVNESLYRIQGRAAEMRPGAPLEKTFPAIAAEIRKVSKEVLEKRQPLLDYEFSSRDEQLGGPTRYWLANLYPLSLGSTSAVSLALQDVSEGKAAQREILASKERYELAAQGANDGLWDWDLREQTIYYSIRWKSMIGFEESEIGEGPEEWAKRVHPEDLSQMRVKLRDHLENQTPHFECEYRLKHKDGTERWMLSRGVALRDSEDVPYRIAGSQTDISDRKKYEARLVESAVHDNLTGLPNRLLLSDRLDRAMVERSRNPEHRFGLLFLDLDRFKFVNDSLGHMAGDELLTTIARRLLASVRSRDTVARIGGDEFTVLLDGLADESEAVATANRIQEALNKPVMIGEHDVRCSASIGIVMAEERHGSADDLLREADLAMYRAKSLGRSQNALYQEEMSEEAVTKLATDSALQRALERGEFELHYQPIVAVEGGGVIGCEALLRWQRPGIGLASPAEFIPLAEETGAIVEIGEWVLREALRQSKEWERRGLPVIPVSVNLSAVQVKERNLTSRIRQVLEDADMEPARLELELTESALLENLEVSTAILNELSLMGVRLALDDFGTGYSSLSYLKRFPVDTLKISGSFVQDIETESDADEITKIIIQLAHTLRMRVVAEEVEREGQLEQLRRYGCEAYQGFLYGAAQPAHEFAALLAKSARRDRLRNTAGVG